LETADALIEHVRANDWASADGDMRLLALRLADAAIVRLRERAGLEPFDDPLPDQPSNAFLSLRELLR
jgi:hypothetical protein